MEWINWWIGFGNKSFPLIKNNNEPYSSMIDIFVQTKSGIQITNGYKIQNGLVAHKSLSDPKSWNVSDYNSGLCIKSGLKTLNECMIYGRSFVDKGKVEEVKKGERYEKYLKSLKEWKEKYLGNGNK